MPTTASLKFDRPVYGQPLLQVEPCDPRWNSELHITLAATEGDFRYQRVLTIDEATELAEGLLTAIKDGREAHAAHAVTKQFEAMEKELQAHKDETAALQRRAKVREIVRDLLDRNYHMDELKASENVPHDLIDEAVALIEANPSYTSADQFEV